MFDLIERAPGLSRDVGQTNPHEHGAGDMVSLNARLAALAALKPRELLELTVKLLDLPAQATRIVCRQRRVLSEVVGHDPVRAVCRHLDPEQCHPVMLRKSLDLNCLAMRRSPRAGLCRRFRRAKARCHGQRARPVLTGATRPSMPLHKAADRNGRSAAATIGARLSRT